MELMVVSLMTVGFAVNDAENMAAVARLQQIARVYVGYEGDAKARRIARLDIRITGNREPRDVAAALKGLDGLPHLESVLLLGPAFTDEAVAEIAHIKTLRDVQLHRTRVTDKGIAALAELPHLRRLTFWGSGLTDEGLKDVARMKQLQYLEISDAPITDAGLRTLAGLTGLRRLQIANSQATGPALQRLYESLPDLELKRPRFDNF